MNVITAPESAGLSLAQLSPREREIAALVAAHKSSKEIAAQLDLSLNSVNGYIASARAKWMARDRNELARLFLALEGCDDPSDERAPLKSRGQFMRDDSTPSTSAEPFADLPESAVFRIADVLALEGIAPEAPAPAGLEALDERFGKAWRVFAVPILAVLIGLAAVCMLTIAKVLSDLL